MPSRTVRFTRAEISRNPTRKPASLSFTTPQARALARIVHERAIRCEGLVSRLLEEEKDKSKQKEQGRTLSPTGPRLIRESSHLQGLSPALFWRNVHQALDSGPSGCKGLVASLVEEEKVCSAMRSTGFGPGQPRKGVLPAVAFEKQRAEKPSVLLERSEKSLSSEGGRTERSSQGEGTEQEAPRGSSDHVCNTPASADTAAFRRGSGSKECVTRIRNSTEAGTASGPLLGGPEATRNDLPPSFETARDEPAAPPLCEPAALANKVRNEAAAEREASFSRSAPTQTDALPEGALPFDDRGGPLSEHSGRGTIVEAPPGSSGRLSFIGRTGLAVGSASCCEQSDAFPFRGCSLVRSTSQTVFGLSPLKH
jgi:hypothetical protein